jgi:predicted dienelactone hydrolase
MQPPVRGGTVELSWRSKDLSSPADPRGGRIGREASFISDAFAAARWIVTAAAVVLAAGCGGRDPMNVTRYSPERLPWGEPPASVKSVRITLDDTARGRSVPVTIHFAPGPAPAPLVVFSHGIGESRDSYEWLGRALAARGFVLVHPTHAGTDREVLDRGWIQLIREVRKPENWKARVADVSFVIDRAAEIERAAGVAVRRDAIGVAGHSAGAFNAFATAGLIVEGNLRLRDERVSAIVAMSMPEIAAVGDDGYSRIEVPVLHLTGTRDWGLQWGTFPRDRRIPFERSPVREQILLTIERGTHNTFSSVDGSGGERGESMRRYIAAVTAAFLDAHLRRDDAARGWIGGEGLEEFSDGMARVERK